MKSSESFTRSWQSNFGVRPYLPHRAEVLAIHHHQIEQYGGIHGIREAGLLESGVFRPQTGYYNSVAEEAAALMESLANNPHFSTETSASRSPQPTPFF